MDSANPVTPASPAGLGGRWMDQLTIQTPEQTTLEYPLAGIGSRFLALALDTLLQLASFLALFLAGVVWVRLGGTFWRPATVWGQAVAVLIAFAIYYGYFAAFESLWNGQTPGKRWMGLRVIQDSGRPLNPFQAIARNMVRLVDQLPAFYCIGVASALLNRRNKRLGDFVSGTVVVHERSLGAMSPEWLPTQESAPPIYQVTSLTETEIHLIEAFLRRRDSLDVELRARMAHSIADRIAERLGVAPAQRPTDEQFLETVFQDLRRTASLRR
jgi:uncharacterized RDD family membrane protein YckC